MRGRIMFVVGAAAGYVLGARAGRERYEQIARVTHAVAENPMVRQAGANVGSRGTDLLGAASHKVSDRVVERLPSWAPGSGQREPTAGSATGPAGEAQHNGKGRTRGG